MKKPSLIVAIFASVFFAAQASALPLTGAQVTGFYNGSAAEIYGADFISTGTGVTNVTGLDPVGAEFATADSQFFVDIGEDGLISFFSMSGTPLAAGAAGSRIFDFDFTGLSASISGFFAADLSSVISGSPVFSLLDADSIRADLSGVALPGDFPVFTAQLSFRDTSVPEPGTFALLALSLGLLAFRRRT